MPLRIVLLLFLLPPAVLAGERDRLLMEYYQRAVPTIDRFMQRFPHADRTEPTSDFTIFTLFNNIAIIVSSNVDLPEENTVANNTNVHDTNAQDTNVRDTNVQRIPMTAATRLLRIAEEMQDKHPGSRTFGNFRWYWSSAGVTDANAAEFALARMLSIYLDTPGNRKQDGDAAQSPLGEEDREILYRLLERSVHVCLNRRIRPDYTNIAFYNAIHLILLGQILDRPEVTQEGKQRLQNITAHIWNHGVFEYNSPAYYPINIDSLQLGYRHISDAETKQMIHALLELFWTDMSLHWYAPGWRLTGAQSRTYDYLSGGNVHIHRLFAFAGMAPYDHDARYHAVLNSFRALYQPPPEIVQLNTQYPRWITRNWGRDQGQWAAVYVCEDIALGTAGTQYDAQQNIVQVVDIAEGGETADGRRQTAEDFRWVRWQYPPRSYFIADGREDPYGTKLFSTGSGGQQKALHLDALWFGAQHTVDSLGIALYPPEAVADPLVINVQSHFVVRKPESVWIGGEQCFVFHRKEHDEHEGFTKINVGNQPVVFRYQTSAFGIRTVWTRNQLGQPAEVVLVDDGNEHGVYRLTVEHGLPTAAPEFFHTQRDAGTEENFMFAMPVPPCERDAHARNNGMPGTAFWLRIGSQLETDEQFAAWQQQFITAKVHRLGIHQNDIDIEVTGQDGAVSIKRADAMITTKPAAPLGILTLNGNDLGRPILEKLPIVANFVQRREAATPMRVNPVGTYWEAVTGYAWQTADGGQQTAAENERAVRVNHDISWQLQVEQPGKYYLWGRVQTIDAEHDSFWVEAAKQLPDGSFMRRTANTDWHLGVRTHWTWVRLPVPIHLEEGVWQLTLRPREYEGRIDKLFLTLNPAAVPR